MHPLMHPDALCLLACWILVHFPIYAVVIISLLSTIYWILSPSKLSKKSYKFEFSSLFRNGYQLRLRVNVLLHELYPVKDSVDSRCVERTLDLSSQDFIQALRKMDLEDNLTENIEEANYIFQTNQLPLSSFAAVPIRPKPEPSTSSAFGTSLCITDASSPSLIDYSWLASEKDQLSSPTCLQPALTPLCSPDITAPVDSLECIVPSLSPTPPPQLCTMVTKLPEPEVKQESPDVSSRFNDSFENENFNPSIVSNLLAIPKRPLATRYLTGRASISTQLSFQKPLRSGPVDSSRSALSNSSSDSEVDYGTDYVQRKSTITPIRYTQRNRSGSSFSSISLRNSTLDDDYASSSSSRDTFASPLNYEFDTCSLTSRSERRFRDAELLMRAGLPFTYDEVVHATNDHFREMKSSSQLTEYQISVMLNVRKRAVNRLAAERCRRLKVATRDQLAERLASLRLERQLLQRQVAQARQRKQKASDSLLAEQKRVLAMLRGPDGSPLKYTDWRVRLSKDDEVIVVAAGL